MCNNLGWENSKVGGRKTDSRHIKDFLDTKDVSILDSI